MDSLRYFAVECHVDGFRFDLAAALAREFHAVNRLSAFFDIIHQDPILSQVKLIAEPWDVGEGGYQVGNFPILWTEWNGLYRDVMRDFWRGDARIGDFTDRFAGSADLYERDGRRPFASINFVTAHDGFTLADLVSYNHKHNEANLEDNRDGTDDNRSWNCGVEGPSDDPEVNALRARQQRNFIATLLLSQGVPMLLGGDEIGRTQHGNNNAYCQDNEISWYDWNVDGDGEALHEFTRRMIQLRAEHPVFRRTTFFAGDTDGGGLPDVFWFRPDGRRMTRREWDSTGGGRARRVPQRGRAADRDALRRAAAGRFVPRDLQRVPRGHAVPASRPALRASLAHRGVDRGARRVLRGTGAARGDHRRGALAPGAAPGPLSVTDLVATYRLQLSPDFDFAAARALVPYLRALGVSHLYLSPIMQAREGSTHGYDVVDPTRVSDALGGESGFRALAQSGLGVILDVVPNHMAAVDENVFWRERREQFFDLDPVTGGHRRFFDVDDLAGVRVEDPEVFAATHAKVVELVGAGLVDGVRVDHIDGLAEPARYLQWLRDAGVEHVWVEKILETGEPLRRLARGRHHGVRVPERRHRRLRGPGVPKPRSPRSRANRVRSPRSPTKRSSSRRRRRSPPKSTGCGDSTTARRSAKVSRSSRCIARTSIPLPAPSTTSTGRSPPGSPSRCAGSSSWRSLRPPSS